MLTGTILANMEELREMRAKKKVKTLRDSRRSSLLGICDKRRSLVALASVVEQLVMESQRSSGLMGLVEQVMPEQREPAALEAVVQKVSGARPYKKIMRGNINVLD